MNVNQLSAYNNHAALSAISWLNEKQLDALNLGAEMQLEALETSVPPRPPS